MQHKTAVLDNKTITYTDGTVFTVQVGRYRGAYSVRYRIVGNLTQAVMYYKGINIGNGYKKRLVMDGANRPVLARAFS